jgi:hypothetical protein
VTVSAIRDKVIDSLIKGLAALALPLQAVETITESVNKLSAKVEALAINT